MAVKGQVWPVAIILSTIAILVIAIYAVLISIARDGDARQMLTEQTIVQSVLNQSRGKLSDTLVQNAYWDAAYDALNDHLDVKWADAHLGVYSDQTAGIPVTAIFDSDGAVAYHYSAKALAIDAGAIRAATALVQLAARARAAQALPPHSLTGFVLLRGAVYLAAAERVVPNDARQHGPLERRFVLSYLVPLDAVHMQRLQREFHIGALHIGAHPKPGLASVPLADVDGKTIAFLGWQAATPGTEFARSALPIAAGCFILVGILQLIVLRSWMRAAQRMRDEGVAKAMFLANASHELRTPLNAILGFSECMTLELYGPLSERYKEYANDIRNSGQHLLGIVNEVLDLSRLSNVETGDLTPLKLATAIERPLRILEEVAKGARVSIHYADHSGGAEVAATERTLGQILINVGSNAVKFSRQDGMVEVLLMPSARGDFVELTVKDHGEGIPDDKLRFIGQPFFRAHADTGKSGSGLGLAIVKTLVERLNGQFAIASELGVGTTVTIRLPICGRPQEDTRDRVAA